MQSLRIPMSVLVLSLTAACSGGTSQPLSSQADADNLQAEVQALTNRLAVLEATAGAQSDQLKTLSALPGQLSAIDSAHTNAEAQISTQLGALSTSLSAQKDALTAAGAQIDALGGKVLVLANDDASAQTRLAALEGINADARLKTAEGTINNYGPRIGALETKTLHVSSGTFNSRDAVFITSANLVVQNGTGSTGAVNGLGNVILGYDATRTDNPDLSPKTGSHDLVLGDNNGYGSTGQLVSGSRNYAKGQNAAIIGGSDAQASGPGAVVIGGYGGQSAGQASVAIGGHGVESGGAQAVAIAGWQASASGDQSLTLGGYRNGNAGASAVVVGGTSNTTSDFNTTLVGGRYNATNGHNGSTIVGTRAFGSTQDYAYKDPGSSEIVVGQ